ncbi:TPA: hypothetical protein ACQ444_005495, partial [Bacillus cereus]
MFGRILALGDFAIFQSKCELIGGLLQISVIIGSIFNPNTIVLEQADNARFFRFKDFLYCES